MLAHYAMKMTSSPARAPRLRTGRTPPGPACSKHHDAHGSPLTKRSTPTIAGVYRSSYAYTQSRPICLTRLLVADAIKRFWVQVPLPKRQSDQISVVTGT